jgi:hypothetical protein
MIADKKVSYMDYPSEVTSKLIEIISKMPHTDRIKLYEKLQLKYSNKNRKYTRRDYFTVVECAVEQRLHKGYIKNISPSGLFIEMDTSKKVLSGSAITLTFSHPDSTEHVKARGKVVRVEASGIGIHLSDMIPLFG